MKELVAEVVKSRKEEREQQKVDMEEIIKQQEHNKDMEKQVIKIIKEKK